MWGFLPLVLRFVYFIFDVFVLWHILRIKKNITDRILENRPFLIAPKRPVQPRDAKLKVMPSVLICGITGIYYIINFENDTTDQSAQIFQALAIASAFASHGLFGLFGFWPKGFLVILPPPNEHPDEEFILSVCQFYGYQRASDNRAPQMHGPRA